MVLIGELARSIEQIVFQFCRGSGPPRRKNGCVAGFVASTQSKAKSGAPAAAGKAGVKMAKFGIVLRTN